MLYLNPMIDAARENPKVDELYQKVDRATSIEFKDRSDQYWSHKIVDGKSIIGISPTRHPQECLFHELLHADLKNNGHISYLGAAGNEVLADELLEFLDIIDEELQHHRMFGRFVEAGFNPEHFYSAADARTYATLRSQLTRMPSNLPAAHMLPQFLSIIAPGGAMPESGRQDLIEIIRSKSPHAFLQLEAIAEIFRGWATQAEVDPGMTVVEILRVLNRYDGTWVGHQPGKFPDNGHFIGARFTI